MLSRNICCEVYDKAQNIKSKERVKRYGEVYTPEWMVKKMCDMLESESGKSCWKGTFLEPSCGNGAFLVEIIKRKLSIGMSETEAAQTTFGIDILADNVEESIQRLVEIEPTVENFRNLSDCDFLRIKGIGDATTIKLKWLCDFLNGKVDGKYEEQTANEPEDVRRLKQIILGKNEKIHELIRKNNELREEIIEIKRENKKLRKNDITIEKLKEFLNNA